VRVVIADDSALVREGLAVLLREGGFDLAAATASGEELCGAVDEHAPDVAIIDVRMPPTHTDEGVHVALEIRRRHPAIGIVILSQHIETGTAMRLLAACPTGLGYVLKDRVGDFGEFARTVRHVANGGAALDPEVVARLLADTNRTEPVDALSAREREVLVLVAEGRSNRAIGERLSISERGVQKHVTAIFTKLGLPAGQDDNRRVLAVLEYLRPD
jgi:DNA-binding NarL/FixJ family response regulator